MCNVVEVLWLSLTIKEKWEEPGKQASAMMGPGKQASAMMGPGKQASAKIFVSYSKSEMK